MGMAVDSPPPRALYKMANGLMHCEYCRCTYSPTANFVRGFRGRPPTTMPGDNFRVISDVPKGECPSCGAKEEVNESNDEASK